MPTKLSGAYTNETNACFQPVDYLTRYAERNKCLTIVGLKKAGQKWVRETQPQRTRERFDLVPTFQLIKKTEAGLEILQQTAGTPFG